MMAFFKWYLGSLFPQKLKKLAELDPLWPSPFWVWGGTHNIFIKCLVWNKCMFGKRPLASRPILWIRACLKQPRMDRFLEPYETAHDIIYEHRRHSLTRAFATHGWRQRLKTEFQTSSHTEFVRMSIKDLCMRVTNENLPHFFSAWACMFYVFQRKVSFSNIKTRHFLWISQTMSARCYCASVVVSNRKLNLPHSLIQHSRLSMKLVMLVSA